MSIGWPLPRDFFGRLVPMSFCNDGSANFVLERKREHSVKGVVNGVVKMVQQKRTHKYCTLE